MSEQGRGLRQLVLLPGELTEERVKLLQDNPLVDAFGAPSWGEQQTFAYVSVPSGGDPADVCAGLEVKDCADLLLAEVGRVAPCGLPAGRCNVKVLLRFVKGGARAFVANFLELEESFDGVSVAAAHLIGSDELHAVVEAVGDEPREVMRAVVALTDLEGVERASTSAFRFEDTYGWGTYQG